MVNADMITRNDQLLRENENRTAKIAEIENYTRRNSLIISGMQLNFTDVAMPGNDSCDNLYRTFRYH